MILAFLLATPPERLNCLSSGRRRGVGIQIPKEHNDHGGITVAHQHRNSLPVRPTTHAALPKNTSCTLAPVILEITTENKSTKIEATVAIIGLLIGTRKRRNTGMRRMTTAVDTSRILASTLSLSGE